MISYMNLCVCACVHMHVCVHVSVWTWVVYMHIHACTHVFMCAHVCMCRGQRTTCVSFLRRHTSLLFWGRVSASLELTHQLGWAVWPVSLRNPPTCFHLPSFSIAHDSGHYTVSSRESPTQEADLRDLKCIHFGRTLQKIQNSRYKIATQMYILICNYNINKNK